MNVSFVASVGGIVLLAQIQDGASVLVDVVDVAAVLKPVFYRFQVAGVGLARRGFDYVAGQDHLFMLAPGGLSGTLQRCPRGHGVVPRTTAIETLGGRLRL